MDGAADVFVADTGNNAVKEIVAANGVNPPSPTIHILDSGSFTPPASPLYYESSPSTLVATGGGSGNPVTFSIVSGPGSLSGTNNSILTVTDVGTIEIAANQAGNTDYSAAAQVTQSVTADQPAALIGPTPGSTLLGPRVTFTWTAATGLGNQGYWLFPGTTGVGSKDLYDSNQTSATEVDLSQFCRQVIDEKCGVNAPRVIHYQLGGGEPQGTRNLPSNLRQLLVHADEPLHPV